MEMARSPLWNCMGALEECPTRGVSSIPLPKPWDSPNKGLTRDLVTITISPPLTNLPPAVVSSFRKLLLQLSPLLCD